MNDSNYDDDCEEIEQFQQSVRTIVCEYKKFFLSMVIINAWGVCCMCVCMYVQSLSVATTVSHNSNSSGITTIDMSLSLDETVAQQKPWWCMYEKKNNRRRHTIDHIQPKEKNIFQNYRSEKQKDNGYLVLQEKVRIFY